MEKSEKVAFSIGIHIEEFERMTPGEFYTCLDGYKVRLQAEDQRRAYFVSLLMSTQTKEPVKMEDIYEPLWYTQEEIKARHEAKSKADHDKLKEEFGL